MSETGRRRGGWWLLPLLVLTAVGFWQLTAYIPPPAATLNQAGVSEPEAPVASRIPDGPTRSTLKRRLEREGHVLLDGRWWRKETWTWGIDTLWTAGDPSTPRWTGDTVDAKDFWEHITLLAWIGNAQGHKPLDINRLGPRNIRFLAPAEGTGLVRIPVTIPPDLEQVRIKAVSEVHERCAHGRIRVWAAGEDGTEHPLYDIRAGRDDGWHDITGWAKGRSRFDLVAEIEETPHRGNGRVFSWHARYLLSVKDRTRQALAVSGWRRVPAPEADVAWKEAQ